MCWLKAISQVFRKKNISVKAKMCLCLPYLHGIYGTAKLAKRMCIRDIVTICLSISIRGLWFLPVGEPYFVFLIMPTPEYNIPARFERIYQCVGYLAHFSLTRCTMYQIVKFNSEGQTINSFMDRWKRNYISYFHDDSSLIFKHSFSNRWWNILW